MAEEKAVSRRLRKKWLAVVAGLMLLAVIGAVVAKAWWDSHCYDGYTPGLSNQITLRVRQQRNGYVREDFTYESLPGEQVPVLAALPAAEQGPFPCVILLYGIGMEKEFLDEVAGPFTQAGFALVIPEQYMRGERKVEGLGKFEGLLALRRRAALNVLDTRRLVDCLSARPDIDPDRLYLWGVSFGAITGATAMSFEPRLRAGVLMYGGGDFNRLLTGSTQFREMGIWFWPMMKLLTSIMKPTDPIRWVGKVAPRPLLFMNGRYDTVIPPACAEALYRAAGEPKEMIWYDTGHEDMSREQIMAIVSDGIRWLLECGGRVN